MQTMNQRIFAFALGIGLLLIFPASGFGQSWTYGPSLNQARHGLDLVEHNGDIYAIGGWNGGTTLEVLYSGAASWTPLAPLPVKQEGVAAALVGDEIYTFGSYGPSNICQVYDINTNTWSTGPSVPVALYWSTAEAVGADIYLIAGYSPGGAGALDTLYILDTVSGTWTQGASLPGTIQIPASALHGNMIYVFGRSAAYYKYDVAAGTWTTFTGPPSGHGNAAEAVTAGDTIYLIGGNSGYIYEAYKTTELFDPATGAWTSGPDLNTGRYQFGAVYVSSEGNLYAAGGRDENAQSIASVEMLAAASFSLAVSPDPLQAGQSATFNITNGQPFTNTYLVYSLAGPGSVWVPMLNVTIDLASPKKAFGPTQTTGTGAVSWGAAIPGGAAGLSVWLQGVQYGQTTNVVATTVQ